jgi:hypothetical protein
MDQVVKFSGTLAKTIQRVSHRLPQIGILDIKVFAKLLEELFKLKKYMGIITVFFSMIKSITVRKRTEDRCCKECQLSKMREEKLKLILFVLMTKNNQAKR